MNRQSFAGFRRKVRSLGSGRNGCRGSISAPAGSANEPEAVAAVVFMKSLRVIIFGLLYRDRQGDRRWMLVSEGGGFMSQRETPAMALIRVAQSVAGITLAHGDSSIDIEEPGASALERQVRIWEDRVAARDAGDAAAAWVSDHLGVSCRLVFMPEETVRRVDGAWASAGETVGFADGFPVLLISQASLDDLNTRLPEPVPMNRFRPNLVVTGCDPFAEDGWRRIRIGTMMFDVAKPCSRCVVPSIIQETAARDPHINRTLAAFRRREGQVFFGQNLLYRELGSLAVGDTLEVLA